MLIYCGCIFNNRQAVHVDIQILFIICLKPMFANMSQINITKIMHQILTGQSHNNIIKNFNHTCNNILHLVVSTDDCELFYYYICSWLY
jgi:hypothetical protein